MFKLKRIQKNNGMTYVELIVVLAIFAILSTVVMFDYVGFQDRVDLKNLASDIALQVVVAQKAADSGLLPSLSQPQPSVSPWKPAYGIFFNYTTTADSNNNNVPYNKEFVYFIDTNNDDNYQSATEILNTFTITKGDYINTVVECTNSNCSTSSPVPNSFVAITFTRPNSGPTFNSGGTLLPSSVLFIRVNIQSPKNNTATIDIYPSGRIQVN